MTFEDFKIAFPVACAVGMVVGIAWAHLQARKAKKRGDEGKPWQ